MRVGQQTNWEIVATNPPSLSNVIIKFEPISRIFDNKNEGLSNKCRDSHGIHAKIWGFKLLLAKQTYENWGRKWHEATEMRGLNDHVESSPTKTAKRPGNAGIAAFIPGVARRCWEKTLWIQGIWEIFGGWIRGCGWQWNSHDQPWKMMSNMAMAAMLRVISEARSSFGFISPGSV